MLMSSRAVWRRDYVDPIQVIESIRIGWLFMPMLIIFATIGDVSLGNIWVIVVSWGYKALSAAIGFYRNAHLALCDRPDYAESG
jgi:hypothetical protein